MKKRLLATVLAMCLAMGMLPGTVWAAGESEDWSMPKGAADEEDGPQEAEPDALANAPTSGTCGVNATWSLSGGTLTISGSGPMEDYDHNYDFDLNDWVCSLPWYNQRAAITSVVIGGGITSIGDDAFYDCSRLASIIIPDSVISIGRGAFTFCRSLRSITIPNSVISIGGGAFSYCSSLSSIQVDPNNLNYASLDGVLISRSGDTLVAFPAGRKGTYTVPLSVTSIGSDAFSGCTSLTSIFIPNSVTSIGSGTFSGCTSLTSIFIPNSVTSIGSHAFMDCRGLTNVTIPTGITSIETGVFDFCHSLTSVTIPAGVTAIGDYAFYDCISLTSISISDSVTSIEDYAFKYCNNLTDVYFSGDKELWKLIAIGSNNEVLSSATIHYNSTLTDNTKNTWQGHRYQVFDNQATWDEAQIYCESLGGHLATISCQEENDFIYQVMIEAGYTSAYFGLTDRDLEGTWTWVTDEKIAYTNWHSGEPNSENSDEDYAMFYYKYRDGSWNDGDFGKKTINSGTAFICEWDEDDSGPTSRDITISAMDFGDLSINSSGTATAYFCAKDDKGNPFVGKKLQYELTGTSGTTTVTTDDNGIFGITTPHLTHSATFWAIITSPDSNVVIHGKNQYFDVKVKELSYTQEWKGVLNFGGKIGLGIGGGAEAGVDLVDFKLAEVLAKFKTSNGISIKDDYDDNTRTLSLNCTNNIGEGFSLSVGPEGTILSDQKITPAAVSGEGMYLNQIENGMKIKNFDPHNKEQLKRVGMFAIVAPVTASRSQFLRNMIKNSNLNICNMQANENSAYMDTGLKFAQVNIGPVSGALAAYGDKTTWRFRDSADYTQNLFTTTKSVSTEVGKGLFSDTTISFAKKDILTAKWSAGKYLLGDTKSNKKEILATRKLDSPIFDSVSYKVYDGDTNQFLTGKWATDEYGIVTFKDDSAGWILNNNSDLRNWTTGKNPFVNIQNAVDFMYGSGKNATVETTTVKKEICEISIPIGLKFAVTAGLNFGVSGEHSYSWKSGSGALHQGYAYKTATSDVQQNQVESISPRLEDIVLEAASTVLPDILKNVASHSGYTTEDIAFGLIKINGKLHDWYAVISTIKSTIAPRSSDTECYAITSRVSNQSGKDDVILTSTLGEPYNISVYTDETQTIAVTDAELAQSPLTLTLQYTEEMLNKAGGDADTDVFLMRFDSDQNLYVCEANVVQDKEQMTITANMTKSGEYILAVDTIKTPEPDSTVLGDLNGDGKVTMADVIRLARGAAGYVVLTEQEQKAGDVTGDGKIAMADVIRVARYAAGYSPAV